jgi:hypothetical protein
MGVFALRKWVKEPEIRKMEADVEKARKLRHKLEGAEVKADDSLKKLMAKANEFAPDVEQIRRQLAAVSSIDGAKAALASAQRLKHKIALVDGALEFIKWPAAEVARLKVQQTLFPATRTTLIGPLSGGDRCRLGTGVCHSQVAGSSPLQSRGRDSSCAVLLFCHSAESSSAEGGAERIQSERYRPAVTWRAAVAYAAAASGGVFTSTHR